MYGSHLEMSTACTRCIVRLATWCGVQSSTALPSRPGSGGMEKPFEWPCRLSCTSAPVAIIWLLCCVHSCYLY